MLRAFDRIALAVIWTGAIGVSAAWWIELGSALGWWQ